MSFVVKALGAIGETAGACSFQLVLYSLDRDLSEDLSEARARAAHRAEPAELHRSLGALRGAGSSQGGIPSQRHSFWRLDECVLRFLYVRGTLHGTAVSSLLTKIGDRCRCADLERGDSSDGGHLRFHGIGDPPHSGWNWGSEFCHPVPDIRCRHVSGAPARTRNGRVLSCDPRWNGAGIYPRRFDGTGVWMARAILCRRGTRICAGFVAALHS